MTYEVSNDSYDWTIMPATEVEEILQNVKCILATQKFTVPMDREFGITANMLDAPISVTQSRLTAEIARAVKTFEPRARVQEVKYSGDFSDGQLNFTVVVELVEKNFRNDR